MNPRPADDSMPRSRTGRGVVGAFPGISIWPFVLGVGATSVALSLVFGFWTATIGFVLAGAARSRRHPREPQGRLV